jgi:hypothetical protein
MTFSALKWENIEISEISYFLTVKCDFKKGKKFAFFGIDKNKWGI